MLSLTCYKCVFVDCGAEHNINLWVILITFDQSSCDKSAMPAEALKASLADSPQLS